jgi:hypothetical protein
MRAKWNEWVNESQCHNIVCDYSERSFYLQNMNNRIHDLRAFISIIIKVLRVWHTQISFTYSHLFVDDAESIYQTRSTTSRRCLLHTTTLVVMCSCINVWIAHVLCSDMWYWKKHNTQNRRRGWRKVKKKIFIAQFVVCVKLLEKQIPFLYHLRSTFKFIE